MALITFWHFWKEKPMSRKLLIGITIFFFAMGTYKAWEEQYEKAESYSISNDSALRQTDEYSKTVAADRRTIDQLTTALFNQTNGVVASQSIAPKAGNFNTTIGNIPVRNMGDGNVFIGPTDNHGNVILTNPMAIGYNAHSGAGSIVIGAFAGSGGSTPQTNAPTTNQIQQ